MDGRVRLLLTRPEEASRRFLAACEAAAGHPLAAVVSPVMAIRPLEVRPDRATRELILTSEHGARRAGKLGFGPLRAWCVGPRTAAAARAAGLRAIEAGPDADALVGAVLAARPAGPVLHLRGEHARGDVAARLRAAGLDATEAVAYRQEDLAPGPAARTALDGRDPLVAPLFSPRSAHLLGGWTPRAPLHVVALSQAVAEAARGLAPRAISLAARPDAEAMVAATLAALERDVAAPP